MRCDRMVIATMEGWDLSKGVRAEVIIAKDARIPMFLMDVGKLPAIELVEYLPERVLRI